MAGRAPHAAVTRWVARVGGRRLTVLAVLMSALAMFTGCSTPKSGWDARVGHFTYDSAVWELGPPSKETKLADGSRVCDWLTWRPTRRETAQASPWSGFTGGYEQASPDFYLRLVFGADGQLKEWKRVAK